MVVTLKKHPPFGPAYTKYLAASRDKLDQHAVAFQGAASPERKPLVRELIPGEATGKRPLGTEG